MPPELQWRQCSPPWQHALVEEGLFDFEVRAIDRAGNVDPTPATHHFDGTDQNPPDTVIVEAPPNPSAARTATFTFVGVDNLTPTQFMEFECRLDSRDPDMWLECFNPAIYSNLTTGTHTLEVRAYDGNENVDPTPARYTWTVGIAGDGDVNCDIANIALTPSADAGSTRSTRRRTTSSRPSSTSAPPPAAIRAPCPPSRSSARTPGPWSSSPVPNDATGCELESAVLKLYASRTPRGAPSRCCRCPAPSGRARATWATQPGVVTETGPTADAGEGYREFDVTDHVRDMMSGDLVNHGWSVRDASETDPEGGDQTFASRETPQDPPEQTLPVLELTYAADEDPAPPVPVLPDGISPTTVTCGMVIDRHTLVGNDLSCASARASSSARPTSSSTSAATRSPDRTTCWATPPARRRASPPASATAATPTSSSATAPSGAWGTACC